MYLDRDIDPRLLAAAGLKPKPPRVVLSDNERRSLQKARAILARAARLTDQAEFQEGLYFETQLNLEVIIAETDYA